MNTPGRNEVSRQSLPLSVASKGAWAGLKSTVGKGWHATTNLAEDLAILGQFAFGREYFRRPAA